MTDPISGGCFCGALRYTAHAAPIVMLDCQCTHCQKISGTGHLSHVVFPHDAVVVTGPSTAFQMTGDSGTPKTRQFCPTCGTPVLATFAANPSVLVVSASSLDDPGFYAPRLVTYHARAQIWDRIDPTLPAFATMAPRA